MRKLELVSFKLCPYVQRSVITLKIKKAPFEIAYIDLENPPRWFEEISPLGKVPVLRVGDRTVLFESAVINEYLDETIGSPLLAKDPLQKAYERAWIEYGSELLMAQYHLLSEKDAARRDSAQAEFFTDVKRLESQVSPDGPYFRGKELSLVDTAYAPLWMRLALVEKLWSDPAWREMPRVRRWAERLNALPEVKESVVPEFGQLFRESLKKRASAFA